MTSTGPVVLLLCKQIEEVHCVKNVHIGSFSGPYFPTFGLNTEIYSISPYTVHIWENPNQKNPEYGHFPCSGRKGDFRPKNAGRVSKTKKSVGIQKTTSVPPIHSQF